VQNKQEQQMESSTDGRCSRYSSIPRSWTRSPPTSSTPRRADRQERPRTAIHNGEIDEVPGRDEEDVVSADYVIGRDVSSSRRLALV